VTLTLDRVILHTAMNHSSTSTYIPNFIETEETFCGRTYVWMDRHLRPTLLGRLRIVDLNILPDPDFWPKFSAAISHNSYWQLRITKLVVFGRQYLAQCISPSIYTELVSYRAWVFDEVPLQNWTHYALITTTDCTVQIFCWVNTCLIQQWNEC